MYLYAFVCMKTVMIYFPPDLLIRSRGVSLDSDLELGLLFLRAPRMRTSGIVALLGVI